MRKFKCTATGQGSDGCGDGVTGRNVIRGIVTRAEMMKNINKETIISQKNSRKAPTHLRSTGMQRDRIIRGIQHAPMIKETHTHTHEDESLDNAQNCRFITISSPQNLDSHISQVKFHLHFNRILNQGQSLLS